MSTVTTVVRIREALENAIVDGQFPPGAKLDPEALAREFEVSRTPIREALQQLEASGLVRVAAKRGTFVSEWSVEELAERFEVMAEIEAMCARLAARRITDAELAELEAAHEACRQLAEEGDIDAYYAENSAFHACIYRATHNAVPCAGGVAAACRLAALSAHAATGPQSDDPFLCRARCRGRGNPIR